MGNSSPWLKPKGFPCSQYNEMENLSTYKHYATAISTSVVKKPIIVIPAIGIIELSNIQMALALFFVLLFFDFFTGVLASYTEWKKLGKKTKFFTDGGKPR